MIARVAALAALCVGGTARVRGEIVADWNVALTAHFEQASALIPAPMQARAYAMVHLAMHEAVIDARRALAGPGSANVVVAASAAAHHVAMNLLSGGADKFAALYAAQAQSAAGGADQASAREIGRKIAGALLQRRARDGWAEAGHSLGGKSGSPWEKVRPLALKSAEHFSPIRPYWVFEDGTVLVNRRLRESALLGHPPAVEAADPVLRPWREQPLIAWNRIARALTASQTGDLLACARLFAVLNTTLADALLSASHWHHTFSHIRRESPVGFSVPLRATPSAYGLDREQEDSLLSEESPGSPGSDWLGLPMMDFPATPAALAGAAEVVLATLLGNGDLTFSVMLPCNDHARSFPALSVAARECSWSPMLAGRSTRESCVAGYDLGRLIGRHIAKRGLMNLR